jgi:hypothetical protein
MATRRGYRVDQFVAQFPGQLRQIRFRQLTQIRGDFHAIKQRSFKTLSQNANSSSNIGSRQPTLS